jgi:FkbM family methyltransferase
LDEENPMLPAYLTGGRAALEMVSRQYCQTACLGDRTICRVLGNYIVYVDPDDLDITPHLCLNGFWESWITIALARILEPGWYCVDVGANHGYYTLLMAEATHSAGHVLAVEPNPQLAQLLTLTLEVNGFQHHTTVLQKAAADLDAQHLNLRFSPDRTANATLFGPPRTSDRIVEVETVTLDRLTANWPRVDLVKIDAEGAEESIWRGMRQMLARHRDITILMEIDCSRYADPRVFLREIQAAGFPLRYIDHDTTIKTVAEKQILMGQAAKDWWMLFLRRE